MNYVKEYIEALESETIVASKKVKKWYIKHIKPIINDENTKYYFNEKRGERFIRFAETFCKQSKDKWAGKPLALCLFQKAKWQCIFGILDRTTHTRRFREIFDVRGRKNGKSTEHAAVALYLTIMDKGGELYSAATVAEQARRIWEESQSMIDQSKDLQGILGYKVFPRPTIYRKSTAYKSVYKVLSKNVRTFDGLNASAAIIDEIHELPRAIYDILKQSMSARSEPLLSMITTAGFVRAGLFDDEYEYATKVIDGIIEDDSLFPLIYELDDPHEIDDESCWIKANPAIDIIKNRDELRRNVVRMKGDPNFANTVKTKDFNMIGIQGKTWLSFEDLNVIDCYSAEELEKFRNVIVLGGFDLSRTNDLTAFTTLLFDKEKHRPIAITQYWITSKFLAMQIEQNSRVPWQQWVDRGLIRISGDELIDYHDIANYVAANFQQYGWMYQYINYDSYSAGYLIQELVQMGYADGYCLKSTPQGAKTLSVPMQTLEAHLKSKKICYQNNPVTKWMLSNVELEMDRNGNYMPKKAGDKRERKIDGVATILNCYVSLCESMDYYLNE